MQRKRNLHERPGCLPRCGFVQRCQLVQTSEHRFFGRGYEDPHIPRQFSCLKETVGAVKKTVQGRKKVVNESLQSSVHGLICCCNRTSFKHKRRSNFCTPMVGLRRAMRGRRHRLVLFAQIHSITPYIQEKDIRRARRKLHCHCI